MPVLQYDDAQQCRCGRCDRRRQCDVCVVRQPVAMLRSPAIARLLLQPALRPAALTGARGQATAPEKIEVFVDGQSVLVDPGTTVLQVILTTRSD